MYNCDYYEEVDHIADFKPLRGELKYLMRDSLTYLFYQWIVLNKQSTAKRSLSLNTYMNIVRSFNSSKNFLVNSTFSIFSFALLMEILRASGEQEK